MFKKNIRFILGIILGIIISGSIVYAVNVASSSVSYTKSGSNINSVEGALNELYNFATGAKNSKDLNLELMCPGCIYAYTTDTWYFSDGNQTALTDTSLYKNSWKELINETGKKNFLGLILNNETKKIESAYACGLNNGVPFCLKSHNYENNSSMLMGLKSLFNNCNFRDSNFRFECVNSPTSLLLDGAGYTHIQISGQNLVQGYCFVGSDKSISCR